MKECAIVFGKGARMVGVRLESRPGPPAVRLVLVNSGVVHRVGANRMTVALARSLAEDGVDSLRFDMSGIGESSGRADALGWEESAPAEIVEAIDAVAHECAVTVLYGNCGGAAKSVWAARLDARVAGLALTNPPAHPSDEEGADEETARRIAATIARDLADLLARGVRMLFIFARSDTGLLYFERRLRDFLVPHIESGRLRVEIVDGSNHTFSLAPARRAVIALVRRWLRDEFAGHLGTAARQ